MNPPSLDNSVDLTQAAANTATRGNAAIGNRPRPADTDITHHNAHPSAGTDPAVLARYRRPGRLFNPEFRVGLLGNLAGQRLLDVHCGTGNYSLLFAELGARVTGVDADPAAIDVARRRATAARVGDHCELICGSLETANLPLDTFDVVWTDSLLHRHLTQLPQLVSQLVARTRPGGLVVFSEPVNFAPWLRRLRHALPVATHGQHDERPLEEPDLAVLRDYLPDLRVEPFHLVSRLHRFVLTNHNYEKSSAPRRWAAWSMSLFDAVAFQIPGVQSLAGTAAIHGHRP